MDRLEKHLMAKIEFVQGLPRVMPTAPDQQRSRVTGNPIQTLQITYPEGNGNAAEANQ